jgi:hypothetical protein
MEGPFGGTLQHPAPPSSYHGRGVAPGEMEAFFFGDMPGSDLPMRSWRSPASWSLPLNATQPLGRWRQSRPTFLAVASHLPSRRPRRTRPRTVRLATRPRQLRQGLRHRPRPQPTTTLTLLHPGQLRPSQLHPPRPRPTTLPTLGRYSSTLSRCHWRRASCKPHGARVPDAATQKV